MTKHNYVGNMLRSGGVVDSRRASGDGVVGGYGDGDGSDDSSSSAPVGSSVSLMNVTSQSFASKMLLERRLPCFWRGDVYVHRDDDDYYDDVFGEDANGGSEGDDIESVWRRVLNGHVSLASCFVPATRSGSTGGDSGSGDRDGRGGEDRGVVSLRHLHAYVYLFEQSFFISPKTNLKDVASDFASMFEPELTIYAGSVSRSSVSSSSSLSSSSSSMSSSSPVSSPSLRRRLPVHSIEHVSGIIRNHLRLHRGSADDNGGDNGNNGSDNDDGIRFVGGTGTSVDSLCGVRSADATTPSQPTPSLLSTAFSLTNAAVRRHMRLQSHAASTKTVELLFVNDHSRFVDARARGVTVEAVSQVKYI